MRVSDHDLSTTELDTPVGDLCVSSPLPALLSLAGGMWEGGDVGCAPSAASLFPADSQPMAVHHHGQCARGVH